MYEVRLLQDSTGAAAVAAADAARRAPSPGVRSRVHFCAPALRGSGAAEKSRHSALRYCLRLSAPGLRAWLLSAEDNAFHYMVSVLCRPESSLLFSPKSRQPPQRRRDNSV